MKVALLITLRVGRKVYYIEMIEDSELRHGNLESQDCKPENLRLKIERKLGQGGHASQEARSKGVFIEV